MQNKEIAEKLHKPIIRKFEKCKVHSFFKDNVLGADLANMYNEFAFCCELLIFMVNMVGLFLWKVKKKLELLMLFKIY